MNRSENSASANHLDKKADALKNTRRSFIKGSAAIAPVVMTLRSGALLAASSTQCLVKATNDGSKVTDSSQFISGTDPAIDPSNKYYRIQAEYALVTVTDKNGFPQPAFHVYRIYDHLSYPGIPTSWFRVEDNTLTGQAVTSGTDSSGDTYSIQDPSKTPKWVLAIVDANANVVGLGPSDGASGHANVGTSCMTSVL